MDVFCAQILELPVCDREDYRIVSARLGLGGHFDVIFGLRLFGVYPGIVDIDLRVGIAQLVDDVDHARVAHIRAVFLERQAHHQDAGADQVDAFRNHQANDLGSDIKTHVVVDPAAGEDHRRVITDFLRLVGQVIRIDADAMAADQPGREIQEIPLAAGGREDFLGIDFHAVEDHRQFVDQRDVDIALGVLDDLGGFGDADARCLVGAGRDDGPVDRVDEIGRFGGRTRGDLDDVRQPMGLVAGVDALRAVADKKILVEPETRCLFQLRHTDFFGRAGVDGGLVDDHGTFLHDLANAFAGADQRFQVGAFVAVDRRGYGDDEEIAVGEVLRVGRKTQLAGVFQIGVVDFERRIMPGFEFRDAFFLDIEADRVEMAVQFHGERQTDIAQSDDADFQVF